MKIEEKIQWCIDRHKETNHYYDTYLPYEFHLRMVAQVAMGFMHLNPTPFLHGSEIILACWGHDPVNQNSAFIICYY